VTDGVCGEWLDRPPHAECYFRFPESFGRRFMLFADTEEEFDWRKPQSREQRSTTHVRSLGEAHRRLRGYGARTIYLVDHPIATDPRAIEALRPLMEAGECDIGTQLHPWVNPPFDEEVNVTNTFAGNLPAELELAKLQSLTETIEQGFGKRPIVYRAGRYGVGPNSARLLGDLGYQMDVSVRAYFDYSSETGPDFSGVKPLPYRLGRLIEVPLSAAYLGPLGRLGPRLFPITARAPFLRGALARAGLMNRVSLTPEGVPVDQALKAVQQMLDSGHQLLSFSFHSPSVEPGHTPYVRDEVDLAEFYAWWEAVLGLLARRGVTAASVEDVLAAARAR
jgi:hypothetical protein